MKQSKNALVLVLFIFAAASFACGLSGGSLPSQEQVAEAATKAVAAGGTAAAVGGQAVDAAATFAASEQATAAAKAVATGAAAAGQAAATMAAGGIAPPDLEALKEKFAAVLPDENGNVTITITDEEVNQAIAAKQAAAAQAGSPPLLADAQVQFSDGSLLLTANVSSSGAVLTAVFRPFVADGALQFDLLSAQVGNLSVPPAVLTAAEATLNLTLSEAIGALPTSVTLQTVILSEGTMTLTAVK